ncbi:MAG: acetate--CoA ligase family protein [Nanoarchaeota archaeon]
MKIYNEAKTEEFLSKYLRVNNSKLTKNIKEVQEFAKKYKYPIVIKIVSDQALHKSAINGVRIINNEQELNINYNDLLKISKVKKLKLEGILVQSYISGKEVIIGSKKDQVFGQIILFGKGGIYTETSKDFSLRILPVDEKDVNDMIQETNIYNEIKQEKSFKQMINTILKVNEILQKNPNILELDINPLILSDKGAFVVDARMTME